VPLLASAGGARVSLIVTGSLLSVITLTAAVPLSRAGTVARLPERQAVPAVDA
jgi:hypothetical protein